MLLVDYRAGSDELREPLRKLGLPAERGDIATDIAFEGRGEKGVPVMVGIEFKKLAELVGSLRTERLQGHQLLKMRENFQFCYLLIEGELHYDKKGILQKRIGRHTFVPLPGRMGVGELFKRLCVLHLRGGLNTVWTPNRTTTYHAIEALYRVWTDCDLDQHKSHIAIYQAPTLAPVSEFRGFISRIDGIQLRKSLQIEKYFGGSLRKAVNAPISEWLKIEGIGTLLAQHIDDVMEGRT